MCINPVKSLPKDERQAIHAIKEEILVTDIKVVDLLASYVKGGNISIILTIFLILSLIVSDHLELQNRKMDIKGIFDFKSHHLYGKV